MASFEYEYLTNNICSVNECILFNSHFKYYFQLEQCYKRDLCLFC
jgi:hypothetical protein